MSRRVVGVSDGGVRVGEDHPKARLTDREVETLRALRAEGWSYGRLALVFEVSKASVACWCTGRRRAGVAVEFRAVGAR